MQLGRRLEIYFVRSCCRWILVGEGKFDAPLDSATINIELAFSFSAWEKWEWRKKVQKVEVVMRAASFIYLTGLPNRGRSCSQTSQIYLVEVFSALLRYSISNIWVPVQTIIFFIWFFLSWLYILIFFFLSVQSIPNRERRVMATCQWCGSIWWECG